ncbi:AraC family transcriptional regulator [Niabella ginsengisoli]|uniref:AraC family transcriptional regulator n=1 Tax=Niabella ginsengisoli TaxID=522298 RepID=A0ABS9SIQ0_9BACT|nr:AraC family transcriptional regulator [Niabella ginsengisoli]MCH5598054.1 AraC family transcriptional regulator [Niabella ginsengisoli]
MKSLKIKDGFSGELQINIPREIVINHLRKKQFLGNLFITQIGYFPKAKFHYRERPYGCPDNILIYCIDGKGHYQIEDKNHVLQAGQFFILPAGKSHMYQADVRDPWSIYWVHFSGNMVKNLNKWINIDTYSIPTKIVYDKQIIEQWNDMYYALNAGYSEQHLAYANLCLYRFLTFFLCPVNIETYVPTKNAVTESIAYMKAHINHSMSVNDLALTQNLSASHFTALFKSKTGSSPIDYFIRLKIQFACQLLKQSDFKIAEISTQVGYDDVFYFSRVFKKIVGSSPLAYRQRVLSK